MLTKSDADSKFLPRVQPQVLCETEWPPRAPPNPEAPSPSPPVSSLASSPPPFALLLPSAPPLRGELRRVTDEHEPVIQRLRRVNDIGQVQGPEDEKEAGERAPLERASETMLDEQLDHDSIPPTKRHQEVLVSSSSRHAAIKTLRMISAALVFGSLLYVVGCCSAARSYAYRRLRMRSIDFAALPGTKSENEINAFSPEETSSQDSIRQRIVELGQSLPPAPLPRSSSPRGSIENKLVLKPSEKYNRIPGAELTMD